jgi:hypothetical protein
MAFSFDTFVKDQKQSAIDVVDTITPSQIKQVAQSYKDGLNVSPKQAINETLEGFTGIDFGQNAGIDGFGNQAKEFLKGQVADLGMQLEQQILGCINTQIRDLMNKVPEIDFILNFEDRINGILGNFRNKLEQKIDSELRKLAYQKIKVHQVTLFKQRIRAKIKDICPGATPASVPEVQEFNRRIKKLYNKRAQANEIVDTSTTLPSSEVVKTIAPTALDPTPPSAISAGFKKKMKEDPVERGKVIEEKKKEATDEVKKELQDQVEKKDDSTIPVLLETESAKEVENKKWKVLFYDYPDWENIKAFEVAAVQIRVLFDSHRGDIISNIDAGTRYIQERATGNQLEKENYVVEYMIESTFFGSDPNIPGAKRATVSYGYKISRRKNLKGLLTVIFASNGTFNQVGNSYADANLNLVKMIEKDLIKSACKVLAQKNNE